MTISLKKADGTLLGAATFSDNIFDYSIRCNNDNCQVAIFDSDNPDNLQTVFTGAGYDPTVFNQPISEEVDCACPRCDKQD